MKKKKTDSSNRSITVENGRIFGDFINKVSMGNSIPDALFTIEDSHISSRSVDTSQTMFSMCMCYIGETNIEDTIEIGIPQLITLVKYLVTDDPYVLTIGEDSIVVRQKGKKGILKIRTISIDDISTALSEDITEESLDLEDRIHFELKGEKLEELQGYMALTGCSCVVFEVEKGRLFATSPASDTVQFKLYMCKTKEKELRVATYAKPINSVLGLLKGAPVSFYLLQDREIILEQEGNYWGIQPIEE